MTCATVHNKPAQKWALVFGPGVCKTMNVGESERFSHNFEVYVPRLRTLQKGRPPQEVYLYVNWVLLSEEALQIEMAWQMGLALMEAES